ncbi:DsbA family protein [Celeribacter marinus]|uniref:Periplasmic thiol:disulfide interchange protein DsbA n=1 Tax=Celeribacter marinus TaxID=1397108 RepID=A0A0N7HIQ0_9RHOB|nr:DsbA family protein [Celeribacter marinus]ALI55837.1 periplasmic thiol:disulfide interchange protein DsbA [Celeribacter marinus]SFK90277.1 Protein-disulfide isomerase [Celeribacter marinus]
MNRRTFLSTTALAVTGFVTSFAMPSFAQDADAAEPATVVVPDLTMGDDNAPIEIIEYASYTCPHCASFHDAVFKALKADYIDTGKVKFTYREIYFDKFGLWASMVARCGGSMRYFGIQTLLYEQQSEWIAGGKDAMQIVENLRKIGKTAGLSDTDLDACMNNGEMAQAMYEKATKEAEADDISSTPSLVIDGVKHSNMSYADLKKILDEKLAE